MDPNYDYSKGQWKSKQAELDAAKSQWDEFQAQQAKFNANKGYDLTPWSQDVVRENLERNLSEAQKRFDEGESSAPFAPPSQAGATNPNLPTPPAAPPAPTRSARIALKGLQKKPAAQTPGAAPTPQSDPNASTAAVEGLSMAMEHMKRY